MSGHRDGAVIRQLRRDPARHPQWHTGCWFLHRRRPCRCGTGDHRGGSVWHPPGRPAWVDRESDVPRLAEPGAPAMDLRGVEHMLRARGGRCVRAERLPSGKARQRRSGKCDVNDDFRGSRRRPIACGYGLGGGEEGRDGVARRRTTRGTLALLLPMPARARPTDRGRVGRSARDSCIVTRARASLESLRDWTTARRRPFSNRLLTRRSRTRSNQKHPHGSGLLRKPPICPGPAAISSTVDSIVAIEISVLHPTKSVAAGRSDELAIVSTASELKLCSPSGRIPLDNAARHAALAGHQRRPSCNSSCSRSS